MYNQTVCEEQNTGCNWLGWLLFIAIGIFIGRHTAQVNFHILPTVMGSGLGLTFCVMKVALLFFMAVIGFLTFLCTFSEACDNAGVWDGLELLLIVLPLSALGALPTACLMWSVLWLV